MIYYISKIEKISKDIFNEWLEVCPEFRKEHILKIKYYNMQLQSLCSFRLLCYALGFTPNQFEYTEKGKPFIPNTNIHFSISHCANCVAVGVSNYAIGVDVEIIRNYPASVMQKAFTDNEILQITNSTNPNTTFFKLWTLKESYIKALSLGLAFPLKDVEFNIEDGLQCSDNNFCFSTYTIQNNQISTCGSKTFEIKSIRLENLL